MQITIKAFKSGDRNFDNKNKKQTYRSKRTLHSYKMIPKRVLKRDKVTVFFWYDGTKTVVRKDRNDDDSIREAWIQACVKREFGSSSAVKHASEYVQHLADIEKQRYQ